MRPGDEVQILRPSEQTRAAFDHILENARHEQSRVSAPSGKMSLEMLRDLAQENCHVALNVLTEVAESGSKEAARVAAANAILDRAHGKVSGDTTQVNVQVVTQSLSESDREILALYRKKIVDEMEDGK